MEVLIAGKKLIRLEKSHVIDVGGEATLFRKDNLAIKIYLQPTLSRARKLKDFLSRNIRFPGHVVSPMDLVFDSGGQKIIGFTMRLLPANLEPLVSLSSKKFRAQSDFSAKKVLELFLSMYPTIAAIHQNGFVIGDLNGFNELFSKKEVWFIDVDSYQFGPYPCPVGTEAYLDPNLYGLDLSKKPSFGPENDWYSFAVLLFYSLLLVHPYGGMHPRVKLLTQRARQRITVLDQGVIYPKIGFSPEILTDQLGQVFWQYFKKGWRGVFPKNELESYLDSLMECPACHSFFPHLRNNCPLCTAKNLMIIKLATSVSGCQVEKVMETPGQLLCCRLIGSTLYCLAKEQDEVVLYTKPRGGQLRKINLFAAQSNMSFGLIDDHLIVSPDSGAEELLVFSLSSSGLKPLFKTSTEVMAGGKTVFACSERYLYRIVSGMLMKGEIKNGELVERPVTSVLPEQTWFTVSPNPISEETVFGFLRVFSQYEWFMVNQKGRFEVLVEPLAKGERLIDFSVKFSDNSLVLLRKTRKGGIDYVRVEQVEIASAKVVYANKLKLSEAPVYENICGQVYASGLILHPTDSGIVKEKIAERSQTTFSETEKFVDQDDELVRYGRGLLVIKPDRVLYLTTG